MKKNNLLKLLGIAFVVAIAATGVFYGLFVTKMSSNTGSGKMLVVAATALKAGTVVQAADLKLIPWPTNQLPAGAYGDTSAVAGNTVFDPVEQNEPVLAAHLASSQSGGGAGVPEGLRAVSVHVTDSTGVLALLRAGQKVDVQVVIHRGDKNDTVERTALEDLTVLSVISQPEQGSQGQNLPVVTLLANPADADVLGVADSGARVRLTLRNPLDNTITPLPALSISGLMHSAPETHARTPHAAQ